MRPSMLLLAALLPIVLVAGEASEPPFFTLSAWPAIICDDEAHHLAFHVESAQASILTLAWDADDGRSFPLPQGGSDGLLPLPHGLGLHQGLASSGGSRAELAVRLAEATGPWPIATLRNGLPVDEQGLPVVLVDHRRSPNSLRRERLVQNQARRPTGPMLLVGDPLAVPGGEAWQGLTVERRVAVDERYPQHAVLLALADLKQPHTVVWSPGNAALLAGTWEDEARLCAAVSSRCAALMIRPRLVVALPPWPRDDRVREEAARRTQVLSAAALAAGWELLDLAAVAGDPAVANRVADGLYADYPVGEAQERVRAALRETLQR